jgi:superfamily II DNA or RNA helicase
MGVRQRRRLTEALASVPENEPRVLLATGRYIGEGFDDARLDTLFLTLPVSWRGTIQQYAGRLHRLHAGKQVVQIYDYVDVHVPVLLRMLKRRIAGYEEIGYSVRYGSERAALSPDAE